MENKNTGKNIIAFLSAQTVSLFGSALVQYAIVWYVTLETSSGKMMMISTLCGFLPQVLISLFAGVWVDKYTRKNLIMLADASIAVSTLVLAVMFLMGHKYLWLLFLTLLIRSAGAGIQTPAVNAILPQIVPKENLLKINGINSSLMSLTMLIAPAASAALLSVASIETVFFVDVITAIIGIVITYLIPIPPHEKENSENSGLENIKNGFVYLRENPFIKRLLIFQLRVLFFVSPSAFLINLFVARTFGTEYWRLGASEMIFSLGAVLGGVLIAKFCDLKSVSENKFNLTIAAGMFYGVLTILLGLTPFFALYLLINLFLGVTLPFYNSPITSILQESVPEKMQGRVFGFMQIVVAFSFPMGMVLFGPLADFVSIQMIFICSGIAIVLFTLLEIYTNIVK